jgi:hypothetical protein
MPVIHVWGVEKKYMRPHGPYVVKARGSYVRFNMDLTSFQFVDLEKEATTFSMSSHGLAAANRFPTHLTGARCILKMGV